MIREIELYEKPLEIIEKLGDNDGAEMSAWQLGFICGLIKQFKPTKIVEVGVAAGGTTAILLNCISELGLNTEVHSVDLNERYYRDKNKKTGFLVQKCKAFLQWDITHKMYLGGVLPQYLDEIGSDIDFLILDTVHFMPGEILDFLACLPKIKEGACVVLHDIILNHTRAPEAFATKLLLSSVVGEKIICKCNDNIYNYTDIGAFRVTKDTRKYIENLFLSLTVTWKNIPDMKQLELYNSWYKQYYSAELCEEFLSAVHLNNESFERRKADFGKEIYDMCKLIKKLKEKENVYIYGCGNYGRKIYNILLNSGINIKGFVISENQIKPDIEELIEYVSDIDDDKCTYVIAMSIINQKSIDTQKLKGECLNIDYHLIEILKRME